VNLAKRDLVPLALGERAGERVTGVASLIIRDGMIAMTVRKVQTTL